MLFAEVRSQISLRGCVCYCVCERVNIGVLFRVKSLILARRVEGEGGIEGEKNKK